MNVAPPENDRNLDENDALAHMLRFIHLQGFRGIYNGNVAKLTTQLQPTARLISELSTKLGGLDSELAMGLAVLSL